MHFITKRPTKQVLCINHDLGKHDDDDVLDVEKADRRKEDKERSQRKAFLRELDAMIRLRSPYTVNVYGVVTSLPDRLILVMELLAGGDLRTMLKNTEHALSEDVSRRIIGDICAGMTFLHSKVTVHGDLKSANVLLDGDGRAKVRTTGGRGWCFISTWKKAGRHFRDAKKNHGIRTEMKWRKRP